MSKDKNTNGIDLSKYKDLDSVSLKKMNFGLWLSENRKHITKIVIIFLIALSVFFFVYSLYNYVIYFRDIKAEKENIVDVTGSSVVSQRNVAADLVVRAPQIFKNNGNYDLVASVSNPNDKFSASFQYCFVVNKTDVGCSSVHILPSEEKYVLSLGQKLDAEYPSATFEIRNISWKRINAHDIPDWNYFYNERLNFGLKDIKFTPAGSNTSTGKNNLSSLEFNISNLTNYGYYSVPLNIALYNGSDLVGVNIFIVNNFLAGETKGVSLSWLSNISRATRVEIRPNLNILDDSIYLKYQGFQ